jgi:hypothetical protein
MIMMTGSAIYYVMQRMGVGGGITHKVLEVYGDNSNV